MFWPCSLKRRYSHPTMTSTNTTRSSICEETNLYITIKESCSTQQKMLQSFKGTILVVVQMLALFTSPPVRSDLFIATLTRLFIHIIPTISKAMYIFRQLKLGLVERTKLRKLRKVRKDDSNLRSLVQPLSFRALQTLQRT